jgi:uncharacterized protein (TIGR00725 family)
MPRVAPPSRESTSSPEPCLLSLSVSLSLLLLLHASLWLPPPAFCPALLAHLWLRLMAAAAPAAPASARPFVCVFGASWAQPDSALFQVSVDLGRALGEKGFSVVTGGYNGCMEGASRGAVKAGAEATGVLVPSLFPQRYSGGNEFLTCAINETTLLSRIDKMLHIAPKFVVALPGTLGTLTEILCVWNQAMLAPLRQARPSLLVAFRDPWERTLEGIMTALALPREIMCVKFVDTVEEAVSAVMAEQEELSRAQS